MRLYTIGNVLVTAGKAAARTPGSKHTAWMANVSWTGKLMEAGATGLTIGYASYKEGRLLDHHQLLGRRQSERR